MGKRFEVKVDWSPEFSGEAIIDYMKFGSEDAALKYANRRAEEETTFAVTITDNLNKDTT